MTPLRPRDAALVVVAGRGMRVQERGVMLFDLSCAPSPARVHTWITVKLVNMECSKLRAQTIKIQVVYHDLLFYVNPEVSYVHVIIIDVRPVR